MKKLKKLERQWNAESDGSVMFQFDSIDIMYFVVSVVWYGVVTRSVTCAAVLTSVDRPTAFAYSDCSLRCKHRIKVPWMPPR
jgi:hypothetical protein